MSGFGREEKAASTKRRDLSRAAKRAAILFKPLLSLTCYIPTAHHQKTPAPVAAAPDSMLRRRCQYYERLKQELQLSQRRLAAAYADKFSSGDCFMSAISKPIVGAKAQNNEPWSIEGEEAKGNGDGDNGFDGGWMMVEKKDDGKVDVRAEDFIASFHASLKLERQRSIEDLSQRLARGV